MNKNQIEKLQAFMNLVASSRGFEREANIVAALAYLDGVLSGLPQ